MVIKSRNIFDLVGVLAAVETALRNCASSTIIQVLHRGAKADGVVGGLSWEGPYRLLLVKGSMMRMVAGTALDDW